MDHPLEHKVIAVRRSARRTALVYGFCSALVIVAIGTLIAGGLDYYLRVEYRPVRVLISLGLLLIVAWGVYRYLLPNLRSRFTNVRVAQQVQAYYPELKDKLASAVEFLGQSEEDPLAGSAALRRAVVVEATADLERIELNRVVDRIPAIRAACAVFGVALLVAVVVLASPTTSSTALARLVNPLSDRVWPKVNQLAFAGEPVVRIASGTEFEVEVVDENGTLPDEVTIEYRYEDESGFRVIAEPMHFVNGVMVASRENVRRPFSYRAVGGDDWTAWIDLEVLDPPRVESLQVQLKPPAYSGWPVTNSPGRVVGLVGTRIELAARVSKPLESAAIVVDGKKKIPALVSEDGLSFSASAETGDAWRIEESGTYWFDLVDSDGITGGGSDKWQIRAIADEPPSVNIEVPVGEQQVTAEAVVPLRVLAKDRLAIKDVSIRFERSDLSDQGAQSLSLYEGPEKVAPVTEQQLAGILAEGDRRVIEYDWQLEKLQLGPGSQITYHVAARDYQPAEGTSPTQRIIIISKRELEEQLARRQVSILGDLARALKGQKEARGRNTELEIQLAEVGRLKDEDVPKLQGLSLAQRDVRRALISEDDSILGQISALLADLENNKVDSPDISRQMQNLSGLIRRLDKENFSQIESELTTAEKNIQSNLDAQNAEAADDVDRDQDADSPTNEQEQSEKRNSAAADQRNREAHQALTKAGRQQDQVIASLESALGDLQRWDNSRKFARDLAAVESGQRTLLGETENARDGTLGRDPKELSPQQRADLKKLSERQKELARQFDKIVAGMNKATAKLGETDPLAAESIADAIHQAQQKAISGRMRSTGDGLSRNQVGQAAQTQRQIADDLQEMLDTLANRREQELTRLVKKLREAEAELEGLRKQQEGLKKKIKAAEQLKNDEERRRELRRLAKEQRKIQDEVDRLARRLRRLQANRSSNKLADAAGRMQQSGESGEAGQGGQAAEQAQQAERDLEEAQQRLAQARRQAEADLAQEQLARLQDQLKGLVDRQQLILDDTRRLEGIRQEQGRLSRGQLVTVTELGRQQLGLEAETEQMAEKLSGAEVFQRALESAARRMHQAVEGLGQLDTGVETQKAEQRALARLELVIKAVQPDKQDGQKGQGGEGQGGGNDAGGGNQIRSIAELKLLKLMQEELNLRTDENMQEIEDRSGRGEDLDGLIVERTELAKEQGQLADLMFQMLTPAEDGPESDPDKLPDLNDLQPGDEPSDETDPAPGLDLPGLD